MHTKEGAPGADDGFPAPGQRRLLSLCRNVGKLCADEK